MAKSGEPNEHGTEAQGARSKLFNRVPNRVLERYDAVRAAFDGSDAEVLDHLVALAEAEARRVDGGTEDPAVRAAERLGRQVRDLVAGALAQGESMAAEERSERERLAAKVDELRARVQLEQERAERVAGLEDELLEARQETARFREDAAGRALAEERLKGCETELERAREDAAKAERAFDEQRAAYEIETERAREQAEVIREQTMREMAEAHRAETAAVRERAEARCAQLEGELAEARATVDAQAARIEALEGRVEAMRRMGRGGRRR